MKKLSLSLEELRVETFETGDTLPGRGTVRAHLQHTDPRACAHTNNWLHGGRLLRGLHLRRVGLGHLRRERLQPGHRAPQQHRSLVRPRIRRTDSASRNDEAPAQPSRRGFVMPAVPRSPLAAALRTLPLARGTGTVALGAGAVGARLGTGAGGVLARFGTGFLGMGAGLGGVLVRFGAGLGGVLACLGTGFLGMGTPFGGVGVGFRAGALHVGGAHVAMGAGALRVNTGFGTGPLHVHAGPGAGAIRVGVGAAAMARMGMGPRLGRVGVRLGADAVAVHAGFGDVAADLHAGADGVLAGFGGVAVGFGAGALGVHAGFAGVLVGAFALALRGRRRDLRGQRGGRGGERQGKDPVGLHRWCLHPGVSWDADTAALERHGCRLVSRRVRAKGLIRPASLIIPP
jgi:hypothetical protein